MTFDGSTILHDQEMSPSQARRRSSAARRPLCDLSNNSPAAIVRKSLGKQLQDPPVQEPTVEESPVETFDAPTAEPVRKLEESNNKTDWAFWGSIIVAVAVFALMSASSSSVPATTEKPTIMVSPEYHSMSENIQDIASVVDNVVADLEEEKDPEFVPEQIEISADETEEEWVYQPSAEEASDEVTEEEAAGEYESPWEAAIISGPIHLPNLDGDSEWSGFARLTQVGELYLFDEPSSDAPAGMISLDGCTTEKAEYLTSTALCFPLTTPTRVLEACVGDVEEAMDWVAASRAIEC